MVGALDQQTSEIGVAGVGDAELRIMISRLTSTRSQAEIALNVATSSEPLFASKRQHEGYGGEMTDAMNLQQRLRLRILGLAGLLDLPIVLRGAMLQAVAGLAIGIPVAIFCVRYVKSQLYEITSVNIPVMIVAVGVLVLAAAVAGIIPARRAASIDPVRALRSE